MDIYPQDLGTEEARSVQRSRNAYTADTRPATFYEPLTWPGWVKRWRRA